MLASIGTRPAKRAHVVCVAQRLDEQRVDAALEVGLGTVERRLEPFDGQRVGARHDQRLGAGTSIERGAELALHLGDRDHGLAVEVAAALGEGLVLELDHGRTGALEAAHRALHVERVAEAGVGVDDHRHAHAFGDARQRLLDFREGRQADVAAAEPGVGDRRTREIERLEAGLLGDERRERVVDAGREQHAPAREAFAQAHDARVREGPPHAVGRCRYCPRGLPMTWPSS
jgi:hypothetical protein